MKTKIKAIIQNMIDDLEGKWSSHEERNDGINKTVDKILDSIPDREDEMREILNKLLTLKYVKEKDGKTPYYLEEMPKAWEKVKQLLNK